MSLCPVCLKKYRFVFASGLCYPCAQLDEETASSSSTIELTTPNTED